MVAIRTLETTPIPIDDKPVGVKGGKGYEGGVVGGRGGVDRDTFIKVVRTAAGCAGEVWEALETLLVLEKEAGGR